MPDLTSEPNGLPELRDALLKQNLAFGVTTTVYSGSSTPIDLNALTVKGVLPNNIEVRVSTIDLTEPTIGNAETIKVSIVGDTALPIDGSSTVLAATCLSFVGGGGIGDLGKFYRFALPSQLQTAAGVKIRYLGMAIACSADANDATQFATLELVA